MRDSRQPRPNGCVIPFAIRIHRGLARVKDARLPRLPKNTEVKKKSTAAAEELFRFAVGERRFSLVRRSGRALLVTLG